MITRCDTLKAFGATANSGGPIAAMTARFPNGAPPISLELEAKVAQGEMKWN